MSYVYLISEGPRGPVKIGVAKSPGWRICELQTGNPRKLRIVKTWAMENRRAAFDLERTILDEMASYRMSGEWIDADEFGMQALLDDRLEEIVE